jgi:trk system potassium uptake protein TrkH
MERASLELSGPLLGPVSFAGSAVDAVRRVSFLLSSLILLLSGTLVAPLAVAVGYGEAQTIRAFLYTIAIGVGVGASGLLLSRTDLGKLTRREGFAVVALGWTLACVLGMLPFYFSGTLGLVNSWFECVSGFTGTGSSVIKDIEAVSKGVLFWRDFTHWLGGMGFVALYIALFPLLGVGAGRLYTAESPGPEKGRLTPRIRDTAKILWLIYVGLSVALTLLLMAGGMSWFDSLCNMFGAIGTGGFSPNNASIGGYHSAYIEWVIIVFLWLAATNFSLHYAVLTGKPGQLLRNPEWRFFTLVLVLFSGAVTLGVWQTTGQSITTALRHATFEVVSTATTTGFVTADYNKWPFFSQFVIFLLLFMGGCAGSTAGAMKVVRVQLLLKQIKASIYSVVHPRAVTPMRLGGRVVPDTIMRGVLAFLGLYLFVYIVSVAAVSLVGLDFETALSAVATTMGGVGPGLGKVGPMDNFNWIHPLGKFILTFDMLAGRLEIYTLILILTPAFWRR